MPTIRVFHRGTQVLATEHRIDEAYTQENVPQGHTGEAWFLDTSDALSDESGDIPFEALTVSGGKLGAGPVKDQIRQAQVAKEQRTAQLRDELKADTIDVAGMRELMRLERGL